MHNSLFGNVKPSAKLVHGGKLTREFIKSNSLRRILVVLDRAGRGFKVDDAAVDAEEKVVTSTGMCSSDDEHIIALARVSHVRLLCSHDGDLISDFTNTSLLSRPKGKI